MWFIKGSTNAKTLPVFQGSENLGCQCFPRLLRQPGILQWSRRGFRSRLWLSVERHLGAQYKDKDAGDSGQGVDQLQKVFGTNETKPEDRRIILCGWNPKALPLLALLPCHALCLNSVVSGPASCTGGQETWAWLCPSTWPAAPHSPT